ncbi:MAG: 1-deoxy-D-xylulose-5-phosphate synthase [Gammaproteobacteria bacterium]|nr:1-deoxy-D-xylulose-5-phosphate synthase [Gammaproteobacteria bacterium]NIP88116.1 1-deoxy-D-xylulose-5-phosphate synthase [Gammaproteobacteria bacterium]NIR22626.1 1-deoxy-D-xylulose-5-phosphate synthase [Gammaproteobacteria bacterium]NIS04525.1 1-deoxy-D-xylulose-5-phosphate synthase [Gammaproteobacteria bacterium]NIU42483.1 1-deoxy-D-xylulose-5-phosphate synthase [Gammaproteobacteria bacterium]
MSTASSFPLLSQIESPADLRKLPESELPALADELRRFLVQSVSQSAGHFAAGLGALELTIALHYLYDTPDDRLVWDVGHQSYPHKILTGRRDRMHTVRKWGGISPFPKRSESEYDTFGVGHAGTSIGAALGMALAAERTGSRRRAVAIIGDGGLTCGMAFEALNHAGGLGTSMLVVLNDNEMSISPNVGALTQRFAQVISGKLYASVREGSKKVLSRMPPMWELARRAEEHVKGLIVPGTLFEELGFNYIGPIDGHDLKALLATIGNVQALEGPQLLHVVTKKGKGYAPAEADPVKYHGISAPFDPSVGIRTGKGSSGPTYSQVFGDWLCDMARLDDRLVAITPAMREGSKMERFEREFPERYFDVAIAEQHSVTVAAGMACDGLKPVVAIYSTFLQRAYDSVVHDVVIQDLPVLFAIDRAGVVGGDGPTHAGSYDISFLRCLPDMVIMTPADENETRQMLYTGFMLDQPCAVRYPRGTGPGVAIEAQMTAIPIGRAQLRREGKEIAFLAFGPMLEYCLEAAEKLDATVVNMRFVKPLDEDMVMRMAAEHELLVTVDENAIAGGAGSAVNECLAAHDVAVSVLNLGLPDRFIQHGGRGDMLRDAGLDGEGILRAVEMFRARGGDVAAQA